MACASACEYTATVRMPSLRAVLMMRTAISPRLAIRILSNIGLHPEDAEARGFNRCIHRGGQTQAQHPAGVGRIDDAVVPQTRAGVVGMALSLVLLTDRRLEGFFFRRVPFLSLGSEG